MDKLHEQTQRALQEPRISDRLQAMGVEPMPMGQATFLSKNVVKPTLKDFGQRTAADCRMRAGEKCKKPPQGDGF